MIDTKVGLWMDVVDCWVFNVPNYMFTIKIGRLLWLL